MTTNRLRSRPLAATIAVLTLAGTAGCASMNNKEKGAVIGAGTGAVVGGVIGANTGSTARGAIIGAVVGGAAGAIIGHQMDKQAEELKQNIPGATVERVGEGIQVTFASGLLFAYDSAELNVDAQANLDELASSLDEYDNSNVLIVGHTDATGSEAYNQGLSERRAQAAARHLAAQGVERLDTVGRGEMEPVASNETEAGRQRNRRVEVAIYASEEARAEARRQAAQQAGL
jgi:outer membrane protein OmpA-like peptidoglycan-associated protein